MFTVKPLLTPTHQGGAIFKGGGVNRDGGLIKFSEDSGILDVGGHAAEDQKQIQTSNV